jgi:oxygen-dependent protoporphyrinogen oxidase
MNSVAIIGAGITGLTAAYRLKQRGIPVTVYEAGDRVGGVIRSVRENGYLAEFGPNSILETSPKIGSLINDLDLGSRCFPSLPSAENRYLVRNKKTVLLPTSPGKFLGTSLFTWRAKLRLLREPFIPPAPADVEESVAQFVLRRLGQEFLDYAINPMVAGVYAGNPAKLSVKHAFPKLHALEQKYGSLIKGQIRGAKERRARGEVSKQDARKLSFDDGLQVLPDTLASHLPDAIQLQTAIQRIEQIPGGWRLNGTHEHTAVLYAAPAHKLPDFHLIVGRDACRLGIAPLRADDPTHGAIPRNDTGHRALQTPDILREIYYPPVASIVLGFRRDQVVHPLDGFGMLIPQVEGFKILGTLFSSSLFPNRAPEGHVTLTTYIGGARAPELALRPTYELIEMTLQDLGIILGVTGRPTFEHVVVYPKAIPQYEVGYGRFKDLMADIETRAPGIFFAGHYRDGISLGDSLVSGHDVAGRIADFWKKV